MCKVSNATGVIALAAPAELLIPQEGGGVDDSIEQ